MMDPNEDTEWNDILRAKGILPPKEKPKEYSPPPEPTQEEKYDELTLEEIEAELDELTDSKRGNDDEEFLQKYREKRMAEMKSIADRAKFGSIREVSKADWKTEINDAKGLIVVIHIYVKGNETSAVADQALRQLAAQQPTVKFLRGEAVVCLGDAGATYPTASLPTLLIYKDGDMLTQVVGLKSFGVESAEQLTCKVISQWLRRLGVLDLEDGILNGADSDNEDDDDGETTTREGRMCIRTGPKSNMGKNNRNKVSRGVRNGRGDQDDDESD